MNKQLTQEELEIVQYVEDREANSVSDVKNEISRYTTMAKEHITKKKPISIRLPQSDIYLLKQKALATGISYQNIIQSLVHQYTHGKIQPTL